MKCSGRVMDWAETPTKRHPKICDLFSARLMFFSRKAPIQKRRRGRKAVAIRACPSSNHVSCSECAIKIYGSKEEIRARKSPETVDAPGFAPDASIPVTLYGPSVEIRTRGLLNPILSPRLSIAENKEILQIFRAFAIFRIAFIPHFPYIPLIFRLYSASVAGEERVTTRPSLERILLHPLSNRRAKSLLLVALLNRTLMRLRLFIVVDSN